MEAHILIYLKEKVVLESLGALCINTRNSGSVQKKIVKNDFFKVLMQPQSPTYSLYLVYNSPSIYECDN